MKEKNKKKKILLLTYGSYNHASSRIRALEYLPLFREHGNYLFKVITRVPDISDSFRKLIFPVKKRWFYILRVLIIIFCRYDFVFVQRWFLPGFLIRILKLKKSPFIYDFDDAIYLDQGSKTRNNALTLRMIRNAARVIVSSPVLAGYCRNNGIEPVIITTPVDSEKIRQKSDYRVKDSFCIGWVGSSFTTPFLDIIKEPVRKLAAKYRIRLLLVGAAKEFSLPGVEVSILPWTLETERKILEQMDTGIMPLPSTDYAGGKGGYKLFLYMAAGIPFVASPVGINTEIVIHGRNGFLASSGEEWEKYLSLLIENESLREEMGQYGLTQVRQKYDRKVCFEKLEEIFNQF